MATALTTPRGGRPCKQPLYIQREACDLKMQNPGKTYKWIAGVLQQQFGLPASGPDAVTAADVRNWVLKLSQKANGPTGDSAGPTTIPEGSGIATDPSLAQSSALSGERPAESEE